jgi:hypothetical protein
MSMDTHVDDFIREYKAKGELSKRGLLRLSDNIGVKVPFDLLPLRVKKLVNKEIIKTKFRRLGDYYSAAITLHTYGYNPEVPPEDLVRAIELRNAKRALNSSATKRLVTKQQIDEQTAWNKHNEDNILHAEFKKRKIM